jgi:uncharacterized RDD family membrane protein YckC
LKCPKCGYLGFETGDTCKNCGYDFSLIAPASSVAADPDITIRTDDAEEGTPELWLDRLDRSMDEVSRTKRQEHLLGVPEPRPSPASADELPLFNPDDPDDIPLIALPTAPRAPLSVRRATETPRLRAVPKTSSAPALDFHEEAPPRPEAVDDHPRLPTRPAAPRRSPVTENAGEVNGGRRVLAALIDHGILFAVDAAVLYFTARMAGLAQSELSMLPIVPLAIFLGVLKIAYFSAFTAIGGQTIGKMATRIKVVAEQGSMDGATAIRRTFAGLLSVLPLGIGFLPALIGSDRRALHDRLTGTRVVGLPSA